MYASILAHSSVGEGGASRARALSSVWSPHIDLLRVLGSPLPLVQPLLPRPDIVNLWWFLQLKHSLLNSR